MRNSIMASNVTSKFLVFALIMSSLTLVSCNSKKGPPITGKREAVFLDDDPIVTDPKLKGIPIILPAASKVTSWVGASGDVDHASDAVLVADVTKLKKAWSTKVGRGSGSDERLLNGPVAANGFVYTVDTRGVVTATNIATGKTHWHTDTTEKGLVNQAFSGGLAYENDFLFVVTPNAEVVMVNALDGKVQKRFSLTAPVRAAPTVKNGMIYVVNINNQLEVINYKAGHIMWSHTGIMEIAGLLGGASPALGTGVNADLLVVPYTSGEVYALQAGNGVPLWRESLMSLTKLDPVSSLFHIKARPVVKGSKVYLIGNGGVMMCLDAATGQRIWTHSIGGVRSPAVSGDYLFMVSNLNELVCMNRHNGDIYWAQQLPRYENETKRSKPILWAGPILVNKSLVMAGSNGKALVVSTQTGETETTLDLGHKAFLSPIAVAGSILFLTDNGKLVSYS